MYYPHSIEEICYEQSHIEKVLDEIKKNISEVYFPKYIETEGGCHASPDQINRLAEAFGSTGKPKQKKKDPKIALEHCLLVALDDFNHDRQIYQDILNLDALAEYGTDVPSFKNKVLRDLIPIIRKTLQNKAAKELDKYRTAFSLAQPGDLFKVTRNIVSLAIKLRETSYVSSEFEKTKSCKELVHHKFDHEDYTAFGVIGGGIKSHFIYKLYPEMFPNRGREAIWALWYLSDKKKFGCKEDSEFLMIDVSSGSTQQNYFYPYGLFAYYALKIYEVLKTIYSKYGISLTADYRFVPVDSFLSFVSRKHQNEIDILKERSSSYFYEH